MTQRPNPVIHLELHTGDLAAAATAVVVAAPKAARRVWSSPWPISTTCRWNSISRRMISHGSTPDKKG